MAASCRRYCGHHPTGPSRPSTSPARSAGGVSAGGVAAAVGDAILRVATPLRESDMNPQADNFCIWLRALPRCRPSHDRKSASVSDAAGAVGRAISARRLDRHYCTPDRSMADGPSRPASCHRKWPGAGGNIGSETAHEFARRRIYAPIVQRSRTRSAPRSTTSSITISVMPRRSPPSVARPM